MKRLLLTAAFGVFLLSAKSHAQSGAVIGQADAGHLPSSVAASPPGCVILQRMGRVDRTKTRLYSLGLRGKQFRYVEGKLPEGFSSHGKMTDHDVRNLQGRGVEVMVLESHYTSQDLQEARARCQGEAGKTEMQAELKAPPELAPAPIASAPAPAPNRAPAVRPATPKADDSASSVGITEAALLEVSSTPTEADVYIDERFFGRTPSTIILMPGDHKIVVRKSGFIIWKRKLKLASEHSNLDAALLPKSK